MSLPVAHPEMWMPRMTLLAPTALRSWRKESPHPATVLGSPASSGSPVAATAA